MGLPKTLFAVDDTTIEYKNSRLRLILAAGLIHSFSPISEPNKLLFKIGMLLALAVPIVD